MDNYNYLKNKNFVLTPIKPQKGSKWKDGRFDKKTVNFEVGWQKKKKIESNYLTLQNIKNNQPFYAVCTGERSKITGVDVDKNSADNQGIARAFEFEKMCEAVGTYTVKTPNGLHYYFKYDKDIESTKICGYIDIQNNGRCLFAPNMKRTDGQYDVLKEAPVLPMTPEIKGFILSKPKKIIQMCEEAATNEIPMGGPEELPVNSELSILEEVKNLLSLISPDCSYDIWIKVLAAVGNTLGADNDDVYDLANDWSAKSITYDPRSFGKIWNSLRKYQDISKGTLHYYAKEENLVQYEQMFKKTNATQQQTTESEALGRAEPSQPSQQIDINDLKTYEDIKVAFERENFKITHPVAFYHKDPDSHLDYMISTQEKLIQSYRDLRYEKQTTDAKGNVIIKKCSFINEWLDDPRKHKYKYVQFDPSYSNKNPNIFNTFHGFEAENHPEIDDELMMELVQPYIDHFDLLVGEEGRKYIFKWFANILKDPNNKSGVCLVFKSDGQGSGKSSPFEAFGKYVIGRDYYRNVSKPEHELFGRFSNALHHSLMIQVEEISGRDFHKYDTQFKDMITNSTASLEVKGVSLIEIENFARFVCTTNNDNPLVISPTDRRFCVFDVSEELIGNVAYFEKFNATLNHPSWGRAVYQYLMKEEIYDNMAIYQSKRPNGEAYDDMRKMNIPTWARYLLNKVMLCTVSFVNDSDNSGVDEPNDEPEVEPLKREIQASKMYDEYVRYCSRTKADQFTMKQTGFALKMKTVEGIKKVKSMKCNQYSIDWEEVKKWLVKKNYWDDDAIVTQ